MNPCDSILYPASYFRDMAFFVTKYMTNIFDKNTMSRSSSMDSDVSSWDVPSPPTFRKSITPVIEAAIDGHFSSEWESQLYHFILAIFHRSMMDESVVIGTVVLLDLLGDLNKIGEFMDGRRSGLVLPPYPHKDCEGPLDEVFWENVIGEDGIITLGEVNDLENDFREMLQDNIDRYPPPPISSDDPAYDFHYAGDVIIRPNPFIPRSCYLKMKQIMYAHIRVRMTSLGQPVIEVHPSVTRKRDVALNFPPCHDYMVRKHVFFAQTRQEFPELQAASNEEVDAFLEHRCDKTKPKIGLGIVIV